MQAIKPTFVKKAHAWTGMLRNVRRNMHDEMLHCNTITELFSYINVLDCSLFVKYHEIAKSVLA